VTTSDQQTATASATAKAPNQFELFGSRGYLALFNAQFLGAFNDNAFKNALVIIITYVAASRSGMKPEVLVPVVAGLFILPFFLFSATAGQLADKYDKAMLIRWIKLIEIALMVLAAAGFVLQNVEFLMAVLFLLGTQSTFFGPLKYSILPELLSERELIAGNALIESATFIAIIIGTIVGGVFILVDGGAWIVGGLAIVVALFGWLSSRRIPDMPAANPQLVVDYNFLRQTWQIVRHSARQREIFLPILGLSWFWFVGATYMSQVAPFAKDYLGGGPNLVTLFLSVFAIGIGVGALVCNRLLKGQIHATFVPLGALGIAVFSIDLYFVIDGATASGKGAQAALGIGAFLSNATNWRGLIDLFLIAVSGGLYMVPLNALLQSVSEPDHRARNIAANNIINALFMVFSAVFTVALIKLGLTIPEVLLVLAVATIVVAIYITRLLPGALAKGFVAWLLDLLFRIEVKGIEHYHAAGDKVLIVANHTSFLDPALLAAFVPDRLTFAIDTQIAKNRFIRFFTHLAETHPVDPANPYATRALIECVNKLNKTVIFPEGRLTVTGAMMKIFEGPGMIADKSGAMVLPVRIDGAQYSHFSRLKGKVRRRWFPKIRIQFMAPRRLQLPAEVTGRRRRRLAGQVLYDLMTGMMFESSYRKLTLASFVLGRAIARTTTAGERVGVLLPSAIATAVTFFGLQAYARVAAMLNFSTGTRNVVLGCQSASIKTVFTSRRFVELGKLDTMVAAIAQAGVTVRYLEDLQAEITAPDKAMGILGAVLPGLAYRMSAPKALRDADSEAVVLFTSGTEGAPKGVVLSHANLQANRYQVASTIDFGPSDIVLNALPMFHSFGLTCGTILPVLSGIRVFLYPSPLHYRIVAALAYDTNATIMFGTDTFLAGYARVADPYDFYSMRYVFAGAEKLKEETRRVWSQRYGCRIFEGYGATETAPVLAMNSPMHNRPGSVGRLMPGIEYRLETVPGIDEGGKLVVHGPNIMKGYLRVDQPGVLQPPEDGWYDTGDIVDIDDEGYVFIKGRAKRFAKIAGEMVSLPAVEEMAEKVWPGHGYVAVTLADARKGEQLVLVTDYESATRDALAAYAREHGMSDLSIPRNIVIVSKIPLLGTGKTDFHTAQALAEERLGTATQAPQSEQP